MRKIGKHATLSEVAKKAGVGTTTVSRVINGGQSVDPKTLARVQRAIDSLGYMPNQAARILKGDRTRTIGFVIPSIADPFFSSCAEAAQATVRANDSLLIVLTTQNDPKAEMDAVNVLMRHRVDGLIIAPSDSHNAQLQTLVRRIHIPMVTLDRPLEDTHVPSVVADNFVGAKAATEHLIGHGYKRIVCITGEPHLYTLKERMGGYQAAMREANLPESIETTVLDHASAEIAFQKLFTKGNAPEAIFTLKNSTTIDIFEVLQKHSISVPGTTALLGYDDFQLADTLRPSISVVQQPIEEIGHKAAELLFERLLDPASSASRPQQVQVKTRLILRASCGCKEAPESDTSDVALSAHSAKRAQPASRSRVPVSAR